MKTAFPIRTALIVAAAIFLRHDATATTVDLGTAADFSILGGTAVTFTPPTTTVIGGDVGVSPGTSITGAGANLSQSGGVIHNNDAVAAGARADTTLAYGSAAGALPTTTYLGADNQLGGLTLTAGTYRFGLASTANLIGTLTLSGPGVFIFQATSSLVTASGSSINLINGADACNIIWQVGSSATLGSGSFFDGTILAQASITSAGGSTIAGRLLAGTGNVTLIGDTIVPTEVVSQEREPALSTRRASRAWWRACRILAARCYCSAPDWRLFLPLGDGAFSRLNSLLAGHVT